MAKLVDDDEPCADCGAGDTLPVGEPGDWLCETCAVKPEHREHSIKRMRELYEAMMLAQLGLMTEEQVKAICFPPKPTPN